MLTITDSFSFSGYCFNLAIDAILNNVGYLVINNDQDLNIQILNFSFIIDSNKNAVYLSTIIFICFLLDKLLNQSID